MNPVLRNILAVVAGIIVGSIVNMGLVKIGHALVTLPEGVNVSTPEGMKEAIKSFTPKDFVFPFLAHALGTLAGAFVAAKLAVGKKMVPAIVIGVFFLAGGITAVAMFGGPLWFKVLDLVVAYLPMGFLGGKLAGAKNA